MLIFGKEPKIKEIFARLGQLEGVLESEGITAERSARTRCKAALKFNLPPGRNAVGNLVRIALQAIKSRPFRTKGHQPIMLELQLSVLHGRHPDFQVRTRH